MRDRLIELIGKELMDYASWQTEMALAGNYDMPSVEEVIADKMLSDGWFRPPCKVGQTVYRIVEMSTGVTSKHAAFVCDGKLHGTITPCKPTIKRFIRRVTVTKNNIVDCCENYGKTVFLTKEEAEAALKGGEQE